MSVGTAMGTEMTTVARISLRACAGGVGDLCLLPPSVKREVHFLVLTIYAAEGMPKMDDRVLGITKAGIDAFVEVKVREYRPCYPCSEHTSLLTCFPLNLRTMSVC